MPVAELKWVDTDLWHLPYIVVMGTKGPALVNSEEERRSVTGQGDEISWSVMKNFLTIRHSLAQTGHGFLEMVPICHMPLEPPYLWDGH